MFHKIIRKIEVALFIETRCRVISESYTQ